MNPRDSLGRHLFELQQNPPESTWVEESNARATGPNAWLRVDVRDLGIYHLLERLLDVHHPHANMV